MKENKKIIFLLLILYSLHNSKANGPLASTLTKATKVLVKDCAAYNILLGINEIYIICPIQASCGVVYIFGRKSDGNWVNKAKLKPKGKLQRGSFGHSIAMSKDNLVVGSPDSNKNGPSSGSVNVFKKTPTGWIQTTELLPKIGNNYDAFGSSVAISGNVIVVGSPGDTIRRR